MVSTAFRTVVGDAARQSAPIGSIDSPWDDRFAMVERVMGLNFPKNIPGSRVYRVEIIAEPTPDGREVAILYLWADLAGRAQIPPSAGMKTESENVCQP